MAPHPPHPPHASLNTVALAVMSLKACRQRRTGQRGRDKSVGEARRGRPGAPEAPRTNDRWEAERGIWPLPEAFRCGLPGTRVRARRCGREAEGMIPVAPRRPHVKNLRSLDAGRQRAVCCRRAQPGPLPAGVNTTGVERTPPSPRCRHALSACSRPGGRRPHRQRASPLQACPPPVVRRPRTGGWARSRRRATTPPRADQESRPIFWDVVNPARCDT